MATKCGSSHVEFQWAITRPIVWFVFDVVSQKIAAFAPLHRSPNAMDAKKFDVRQCRDETVQIIQAQ